MSARVSQAGAVAAVAGTPKARASQAGMLAIAAATPAARASQAGLLAAVAGNPRARASQAGLLAIVATAAATVSYRGWTQLRPVALTAAELATHYFD